MSRDLVREEQGIALPLALVGLVAVTLIVSAALVTASVEWAMSRAHRDATQALYAAEAGLNAFIGERAGDLAAITDTATLSFSPAGGGSEVTVRVVHLGERTAPDSAVQRFYSLIAAPGSGAVRAVAMMVALEEPAPAADSAAVTSARIAVSGWQEVSR